ncbi:MAG TPA: Ni/Fe-hydrogenase cytochrome b subunit [Thermoanaerobaculia bacterium]|nr:Ni/Fe-hydrogenase cytochrome b subunit [Thermoanaerobaculia bacterium]
MTTYTDQSVPVPSPRVSGERVRVRGVSFNILLFFAAVAIALIIWRFVVGLGASTALSDGYPWGLWIAFDVVTGTALACGGYALALLVYIFNKGKYHPLVRPAVLTSALGYSIAGLSVMIDVGRPWLAWKLPIKFWTWNLNSVLLEVALCIMAYTVVLWIELTPAFLEKFKDDAEWPRLRAFARKALPVFDKALIWILALGLLLPTMHQSSLGSLMLLAGPRLHGLWSTAFLPLFYLVTCLAMGYAIVVIESSFSAIAFGRKPAMRILNRLGTFAAWGTLLFVALRFIDLAIKGRLPLLARFNLYSALFWAETLLFVVPFVILLTKKNNASLGSLLRAAMLVALAGALYRFDTFLVAFDPGPGWHYFPSVSEQLITIGLVALELAIYVAVVKNFPILSGEQNVQAHHD